MTGPTRRRLLAGCGAGLAALAGCSGLSDLGGDEEPDGGYDRDALEAAVEPLDEVQPPDAFPVRMPAALQNRHRDRARAYLDSVPADPDYPNEAIATRVADQRTEAAATLDRDALGRPRNRLETWRDRRTEAATVRGAHLAATGEIGSDRVAKWRSQVRTTLASFEAGHEYRATDPVAAAVVHGTVERYAAASRNRLHTHSPFPEDPGDAVSHAGKLIGDVDAAEASATDAVRLREQYRHDVNGSDTFRPALTAAASSLDRSLSRTIREMEYDVDADPGDVFGRGVSGTPAEQLFRDASGVVEWRRDRAQSARNRHAPATAVIEAGRGLIATAALAAVVEAVEDGRFRDDPTADGIEAAVQRSRDALETAWETTPQSLAVELANPALGSLHGAAEQVRKRYGRFRRAFTSAVYAEAQARPVPAATEFVEAHLLAEDPGPSGWSVSTSSTEWETIRRSVTD